MYKEQFLFSSSDDSFEHLKDSKVHFRIDLRNFLLKNLHSLKVVLRKYKGSKYKESSLISSSKLRTKNVNQSIKSFINLDQKTELHL